MAGNCFLLRIFRGEGGISPMDLYAGTDDVAVSCLLCSCLLCSVLEIVTSSPTAGGQTENLRAASKHRLSEPRHPMMVASDVAERGWVHTPLVTLSTAARLTVHQDSTRTRFIYASCVLLTLPSLAVPWPCVYPTATLV